MKRITFCLGLLGGTISLLHTPSTYPKRHALTSKIERYEKKAQAAAQGDGALAGALAKQTKVMSFDEARLAQDYYRTAKQHEMIIKCGERLLAVGGDQEILMLTRLELAELFLEERKFDDAERHAQDYMLYYPGSAHGKKASYIAVKAACLSQQNSFRDQQKTHAAIERAEDYLKKYPHDTEFKAQIEDILLQSYLKLIRYEMNIISTQLNLFHIAHSLPSLSSAKKRVAYIKERYLPKAPLAYKRITELEILLAQEEKNSELAQQKSEELKQFLAKQPAQSLAQSNWFQTTFGTAKEFFIEDTKNFFA